MHLPTEIRWSGVSLQTEMKIIAFFNLSVVRSLSLRQHNRIGKLLKIGGKVIRLLATGIVILGVFLVICSGSYADVILSPEEIAPCTELSHLEVARRLLKVLFIISTVGGIESVLSASLIVSIYKRIMPLIMLWIIAYTCIVAMVTGTVVVFCYIILIQGIQTGDTGTLMFLILKLGFLLFSLLITHKFHATLKKQRHYVSVSTIGTLPGWGI